MALEHSPGTALSSIDFTISDEELAWLADLGHGRLPRDRLHSVHADGRVHGSVVGEHIWTQGSQSDNTNMGSDADWRTWGPEHDVVHESTSMATSRLHWTSTVRAGDMHAAHDGMATAGPVPGAGPWHASAHDQQYAAALGRHAGSRSHRAAEVGASAAPRGVQKRRFHRPSGKSAFQRDIELFKMRLAWEEVDAELHRAASCPDGTPPVYYDSHWAAAQAPEIDSEIPSTRPELGRSWPVPKPPSSVTCYDEATAAQRWHQQPLPSDPSRTAGCGQGSRPPLEEPSTQAGHGGSSMLQLLICEPPVEASVSSLSLLALAADVQAVGPGNSAHDGLALDALLP